MWRCGWGWARSTALLAGARLYAFAPKSFRSPGPSRLPASAKIPVYVTGELSVETKQRFFAGLPGFYRTFATREHALLCQARARRFWGIAAWPPEEEGLWYAFVNPGQIEHLEAGELCFGRTRLPAVTIVYQTPALAATDAPRKGASRSTLWLAFLDADARAAVLADLLLIARTCCR